LLSLGKSLLSFALLSFSFASLVIHAQEKFDSINRSRAQEMLHRGYEEIRKNYYDPTFHGIDIDARYKFYNDKIGSAPSLGEAFRDIVAFLEEFHDSHLFFEPPMRASVFDSGYRMQIIGQRAYVTHVRPSCDAAAKLHPGDGIVHLNHFDVNRTDIVDLEYYFHNLAPAPTETLDLMAPDGTARTDTVKGILVPKRASYDIRNDSFARGEFEREAEDEDRVNRDRFYEADDVLVWKMALFGSDEDALDHAMAKVHKHSALILDLRGNPGGYTDSLERLVGALFDHEVKIADRVGRKPLKPLISKRYAKPFTGKLIVMVDSDSGSSAELLVRVVQLENRGTVVGDKSAGRVMEAVHHAESVSVSDAALYAFSITEANLLMKDGQSLENKGVTPDLLLLPTAQALAIGADPVLSKAASLAGLSLDPMAAGKLFPFEWLKL
jgi:carboxyl-terminal processing protease